MRKFFIATTTILIVMTFLSGCSSGSYSTRRSVEHSGRSSWVMSYDSFSGYKQRRITLDNDSEHTFTVEIVTNSGSLGLSITDSDGATLYTDNEIPSSSL